MRAHRDDWEAETAEKRLEKAAREEAERRADLLWAEVSHLQGHVRRPEFLEAFKYLFFKEFDKVGVYLILVVQLVTILFFR